MDDKEFRDIVLADLRELRADVKSLTLFRGWVLGGACVAGALGGVLVRLLNI